MARAWKSILGDMGVSDSGPCPLKCRFTHIDHSLTVAWNVCTVFCTRCPLSPSLDQLKANLSLFIAQNANFSSPSLLSMCTPHLSLPVSTPHLSPSRLHLPIISAISTLTELPPSNASLPLPCSWSLLGSNSIAQVGFIPAREPAAAAGEHQGEPP